MPLSMSRLFSHFAADATPPALRYYALMPPRRRYFDAIIIAAERSARRRRLRDVLAPARTPAHGALRYNA
jgi:hypothetical protein